MKKIILLIAFVGLFLRVQAQDVDFNRWSIELNAGFNKPMAPLTPGYFSPTLNPGHVGLGTRYMINHKFGILGDIGFGQWREARNISPEFRTNYQRLNLQGVINMGRIMNWESFAPNLNLLLHAGPGVARINYATSLFQDFEGFRPDYVYNFISGFTGQVRLTERLALTGDVSIIINGRQTYTLDGNQFNTSIPTNFPTNPYVHATGTWWTGTLGLTYYFGRHTVHADWYIPGEQYATKEELAYQVNEIRDMLKDSDGDGIPDYLDKEPNTPAGARVDPLGRTLDSDGDGIPDHLDKCPFIPGPASNDGCPEETKKDSEIDYFKKAINDNFVNVYFAFDSSKPFEYSTSAVQYLVNFLKRNPGISVEIKGYADEIGPEDYNMRLSERRAGRVKDLIIQAGIDSSRVTFKGYGEDTSVDKRSEMARQLARRVSFEVK